MHLNIYEHAFTATCPNNGETIEYTVRLEAAFVIMAEDICDAGRKAQELPKPYHENIADMFAARFGGRQEIVAFHHGVKITTRRGRA